MTNQNVQTNRHGPQNKGCNQASADSKHYLVSKLRPPCPWAWTKEISVEAYVRDLGSLLMARHWQKHQKQFWKLPHCRDWLDHDVSHRTSDTMTEINISEFHVLYFEFCVLYFDFFLLCFGLCVSLVLLFETKCQWIVVRPSSNVTYVTRAIFVVHFFFFFFFFLKLKACVCNIYFIRKVKSKPTLFSKS